VHIVMKIVSFFIIFKFVNPAPPSFKREFLNKLHTSLLPYKDFHINVRSFERVIALSDLDISSKSLYMQLLLHLKWECYFLLPYGDLYIVYHWTIFEGDIALFEVEYFFQKFVQLLLHFKCELQFIFPKRWRILGETYRYSFVSKITFKMLALHSLN